MCNVEFPVIDPIATGKNILSLRKEKGLTVRNLQEYFGFEEPQAIYRWQYGKTIPSVDNLYALSAILGVPMEKILVPVSSKNVVNMEKQAQRENAANKAPAKNKSVENKTANKTNGNNKAKKFQDHIEKII